MSDQLDLANNHLSQNYFIIYDLSSSASSVEHRDPVFGQNFAVTFAQKIREALISA